jgi:hypothetical protein
MNSPAGTDLVETLKALRLEQQGEVEDCVGFLSRIEVIRILAARSALELLASSTP